MFAYIVEEVPYKHNQLLCSRFVLIQLFEGHLVPGFIIDKELARFSERFCGGKLIMCFFFLASPVFI